MPARNKKSRPEVGAVPRKADAPQWLLDNIAELSRNARTLYIIYIGLIIYCLLTIQSINDGKVILNKEAHLPIVNLEVPLSIFVKTAPLVAIFVFLYFQFYLQALRRTIQELRANYAPPPPRRLYPWMLNLADEPEEGLLGFIEGVVVKLSLWLLLPATLMLFFSFTLMRHDRGLTFYEWASSVSGAALTLWLWHRYDRMAVPPPPPVPLASLKSLAGWQTALRHHWRKILAGALLLFSNAGMLYIMFENDVGSHKADLRNAQLSEEKKYGAYWVDLRGVHLESAEISNAFLRHADLRKASLQKADLERADLGEADLSEANLEGAVLTETNLEQATLSDAVLAGANLSCARLKEAELQRADLSGALLIGADLRDFRLGGEVVRDAPEAIRNACGLLRGAKSLAGALFSDPAEQFLRACLPGHFTKLMSQDEFIGLNVAAAAPGRAAAAEGGSEADVVIYMADLLQGPLLEDYTPRTTTGRRIRVAELKTWPKGVPTFNLRADDEAQAEFVRRNIPEWAAALGGTNTDVPTYNLFVSGRTPVLLQVQRSTYYVEEIFMSLLPTTPAGGSQTFMVFVRSKEIPVPTCRR